MNPNYYHYQQRQWRQPPVQSDTCPVCFYPHFPFCVPRDPAFDQHPPPPYPRSIFDPYQYHQPPTPPPPPPPPPAQPMAPYNSPHVDGFNDPRSWQRKPGFGYDHGFVTAGEVDRSFKRPRVDDFVFGQHPVRALSEDERRLKLIRDHGGASLPQKNTEMYNVEEPLNDRNATKFHSSVWQGYQQGSNALSNYVIRPPLPASSPPPLPAEPPVPPSLFPLPAGSPAAAHTSYLRPVQNNQLSHASASLRKEESQALNGTLPVQYVGEKRTFQPKQLAVDKPKIIDASELFKYPCSATPPDHIVVILRGLPGSGKSYLAKMLRDFVVENGATAPRIHSMDDYFMTEVEKAEENDTPASSVTVRSKKPATKKVMEYCYEPEMEEVYRESMLKAFKRTLEDGSFNFVIVDDRNLRVADFAQFWATGKRLGYEVYLLEATYKDPVGCAARNVHCFSLDDIQEMAARWEEAPSLYLKLDTKSLFCGDDLKESGIQEIDMDMEDGDFDDCSVGQQVKEPDKNNEFVGNDTPEDSLKHGKRWNTEGDHPTEVKELSMSKWSNDLAEDNTQGEEAVKGNSNSQYGLIRSCRKEAKSVRWSDQVGDTGFSIGAAKKAKTQSLVIGPGAGYNLDSNPLPDNESVTFLKNGKIKNQSVFEERLRAEHDSFRAVFDRRRQRVGLDADEDL